MFLTRNFRRARTLTPISMVHETGLSIGAINMANRYIADSRNIPIGTSVAVSGVSLSSIRNIMLPNNVPKALGLRTGGGILRTIGCDYRGNGVITTVYTTPSVLNRLKVLSNGGTAYFPNFRGRLGNTSCANARAMASNGVVATGNTNYTVRFNRTVISLTMSGSTTSGIVNSVRYL